MNVDFNLNVFLNIIENIFSNNIISYIVPKKDNLNNFGKILPICDESSQDLLEYEILNNKKLNDSCNSELNNEFNGILNNEFNGILNNEFNGILNNEFNGELNNDKYKFKYDIENGLYDIEIGYISLMENSFNNNNKDDNNYSKNYINEKNNICDYYQDNFNNTHIIDCFDNEDI